MKSRLKMS